MRLEHVDMLWALVLIPALVIVYAIDGQRGRRVLERIGHLPQIRKMTASVSLGRRRLKAVCLVIAAALVVVALARPQRPGVAHILPRRGLDLVVALDFSRSMLATDVYPSRLERAKFELNRLIDGLKGDRIGLVAFAGVTLSYPLTSDYAAAKLFWRDLGPDDIPVGGTNLGEAMRAGLDLLQHGHRQASGDQRKPAQVLVLLTDGADTEGGALDAAREAARQGVRVYAVGIGSREGEVVVLKKKDDGTAEYVTDALGAPVRMTLDEQTLRQIAQITSGDYVQFDPERFGVEGVQKAIAGLERAEEEGRVVREPEEVYAWFLGPAFGLLLVELLVRERRRAARPTAETPDSGETAPTPRARLGERRRAVDGGAALLLLLLLPFIGGWGGWGGSGGSGGRGGWSGWGGWSSLGRWGGWHGWSLFQRLSPDVKEGNEKLAAGRPEEALAAYDRALAARPEDLAVHYDRGAALYALGQLPEAQREFLRATESSDPALKADAFYNMGNALLKQQQPREALESYKRTLKLRPDDRRAKWNLELALRLLERQEERQRRQALQQKGEQQQQDGDNQQSASNPPQNANEEQQNDRNADRPGQAEPGAQERRSDAQRPSPPTPAPQKEAKRTPPDQNAGPDQGEKSRMQGAAQDSRPNEKPAEPKSAGAGNPTRDIDRQDAEAVLDAFERVEPTVQKDLARRAARRQHPRKDW